MKLLKCLLPLILFLISFYAPAQISFGVNGGLNINGIGLQGESAPYEFNPEANVGYHAGVYGILKISDKLSFVPLIQFSKRGYDDAGTRVNLNYLEAPLLLSMSTLEWLHIEIGPQAGFNISTHIRSDDGRSRNLPDLYSNFDFGLTGGLRSDLSERISIYARYYFGLTAIDSTYLRDNNNVTTVIEEYNRGLQLGLGYRIK